MPTTLQQRSSSSPSLQPPIMQTAFQQQEWMRGRVFLWALLEGFPRSFPKSSARSLVPSLGSPHGIRDNLPLLAHLAEPLYCPCSRQGQEGCLAQTLARKLLGLNDSTARLTTFVQHSMSFQIALVMFIALVSEWFGDAVAHHRTLGFYPNIDLYLRRDSLHIHLPLGKFLLCQHIDWSFSS